MHLFVDNAGSGSAIGLSSIKARGNGCRKPLAKTYLSAFCKILTPLNIVQPYIYI
jgi:hypothetical protein